jgi:AcrR family transcriptional regulator
MASNTKSLILQAAKQLFNQHRYGNVTIKEIAAHLGISAGNIWYHYKDKREMLRDISSLFIAASHKRMELEPTGGPVVPEFASFLYALNAEIGEFRFMYRDQADYGSHTQQLQKELPLIYSNTFAQFEAYLQAMKHQGQMAIQDTEIRPLTEILVALARYGLEFYRESQLEHDDYDGVVRQSINAQCFVINRYVTPLVANELQSSVGELMHET